MAIHAGTAGSVVLVINGTAAVAGIEDWTLRTTRERFTTKPFGSTVVQRKVGVMDFTGSFKGNADLADTTGQLKLKNAYVGGSVVELRLYELAASYWAGSAYLTDMQQAAPMGGMATAEFTFEGDGSTWTYT